MNKVDTEYFRIVNDILTNGRLKKNRTGVDTIGIFGAQAKYNVDLNAFPLLTTKKVHWPAIVHELLWFISGDTNIKYLVDNNVRIWNEWAYKKYTDTCISKIPDNELESLSVPSGMSLSDVDHLPMDMFIERIKNDVEFATKWGELGEGTYGGMWRAFPYFDNSDPMCRNQKTSDPTAPLDIHYETSSGYACEVGHVDQLQKVINKLKTNPDDRRMIVSAWHPYWVDHCALPPCHCLFHFHTEELTLEERTKLLTDEQCRNDLDLTNSYGIRPSSDLELVEKYNIPTRRLNCLLYQRSVDTALGKPFNIASYALLTAMIAQTVNMVPGMFTHSMGDTHIYVNHIDGLKLQLTREPKKLPKVWLNPEVKSLFDFKYDDIKLLDYEFHSTIKFDVAV
jgi:thymidylate synthase